MTEQMDLCISHREFERYFDVQSAFHAYYRKLCPNRPLAEALEFVFKKYLLETFYRDDPLLYEKLKFSNEGHKKIIELMQKQDYETLSSLIFEHWKAV